MKSFWMLSFMRIFSGIFMMIMGVGFYLQARLFESMLLKGPGFFIGACLVLAGGFVLFCKKKKPEDVPPEKPDDSLQKKDDI